LEKEHFMRILPPRFPYGAFFLIFLDTMSWGRLRKEWLEKEDHSLWLIYFNHNFLEEVL
jgi:hypothetical protein